MLFNSRIPWELVWKHKPTSLHHRVRFTGHQLQRPRRLLSVPSMGQMLRHPKWFVYSEVCKKKKKSTELNHQEKISLQDQLSYAWQLGLLSGILPWSALGPRNSLRPLPRILVCRAFTCKGGNFRRHSFFVFFKIVYMNCQKLIGASLDTSSIGLLCGIFASENQDPCTSPPGPEKLNQCHRPAGSSLSDSGLSCVLQRWLLHRSEHRDSRLNQTITASGDENADSPGTSPGSTADLAV